jgi:FkbM family methyltransferase
VDPTVERISAVCVWLVAKPIEISTAVLPGLKQLSIATGLYRPSRWLIRQVRPIELRTLRGDVALYRSLLPAGATCFDVGANIGAKSEALLRAGAARVVSFEPCPPAARELKARCGWFGNWSIVEAALGSASAVAVLYSNAQDSAKSSLLPGWSRDHGARYHVPVVTLDAAIQCFGRPDFCKIDTEGWEPEVLKGLSRAIPLIAFQFHLSGEGAQKAVDCLRLLQRLGSAVVNVTPAETPILHFTEWRPLEEFAEWFPGDLRQALPGDPYGDIWVKTKTAP